VSARVGHTIAAGSSSRPGFPLPGANELDVKVMEVKSIVIVPAGREPAVVAAELEGAVPSP